jgi:hypothetical protein
MEPMTEQQLEGQRRLAALRARTHRIRIWVTASGVGIFLAVLTGLMSSAQPAATPQTTQAAQVQQPASSSSSSSSPVAPVTTRSS